jgi:DNA-binding NarL/FixJ family response regulator
VIRVVLADDHALVRQGIKSLLELAPDIELAGEASDGEEAIAVVLEKRPDVLLLDMRMPRGDGVHVVRALAAQGALPKTLVLTTFDDADAELAVIQAGARGFLLKDVTLERLVAAVRSIAEGKTLLLPGVSERATRELAGEGTPAAGTEQAITGREMEVLRLLASGYSNREIASALFVAEGTIKNHVSHILEKLGVRDRTRAVLKAAERGWL